MDFAEPGVHIIRNKLVGILHGNFGRLKMPDLGPKVIAAEHNLTPVQPDIVGHCGD